MQFNWDYTYFLQTPSTSPTGPREIFVCSLLFYSTRQFNLIGKKSIQGIYAELNIHLI